MVVVAITNSTRTYRKNAFCLATFPNCYEECKHHHIHFLANTFYHNY